MAQFGIPIPGGREASTPAEAKKIANELGGKVVIKAQVYAGGRGKAGGITPQGIKKAVKDITERVQAVAETRAPYMVTPVSKEEMLRLIKELETQMKAAAKNLEFEKAAIIRDRIIELRKDEELVSPIAKLQ